MFAFVKSAPRSVISCHSYGQYAHYQLHLIFTYDPIITDISGQSHMYIIRAFVTHARSSTTLHQVTSTTSSSNNTQLYNFR